MQKIFLFCTILCSLKMPAQNIDVLHYRFAVRLSDDNDTVNGSALIRFVQRAENSQASFDLVSQGGDGKGIKVESVTAGTPDSTKLPFLQSEEKLFVNVPSIKNGDSSSVVIQYKGIPGDGLIISRNKFGDRTFFGDNWPDRAHHWLPCIDRPDDKASCEFLVSAPVQYRVIGNGVKVEEKDLGNGMWFTHWKEDMPIPTKVMVIGVARFASKTYDDSSANVPVSAWVYPQDSAKGIHDFAVAPEMVKFFSSYIGPFPYQKLANVQSTTIFGGMENASCIFYDEKSVTGDRGHEDVVAHEIAHQWFGDAVSEKSFADVWLSEGFATYMANLYWEKKYGKEAMAKRLKDDREKVIRFAERSSHPVVDSSANVMSLLNANSYEKGGWVLHMLRTEVGDTVFQTIIRSYFNQYKNGNANTRDFAAIAEKVSGKDLKPFFDQWLYRPGLPRIAVKKRISKLGTTLTFEQTQATPYLFDLQISVERTKGKAVNQRLHFNNRTASVFINQPVKNIRLDPDCALLFEEK